MLVLGETLSRRHGVRGSNPQFDRTCWLLLFGGTRIRAFPQPKKAAAGDAPAEGSGGRQTLIGRGLPSTPGDASSTGEIEVPAGEEDRNAQQDRAQPPR